MPKVPGSGIKKGQRKTFNRDLKELILSRGKPIELLCNVARGLKIRVGPQAGPGNPTYEYPDLLTRLAAAKTLLAKVLPDMKAQEISGPDGEPVSVTAEPLDMRETARRLALIFTRGDPAKLAEAAEARGGPAVAPAAATQSSAFSAFAQNGPGHPRMPPDDPVSPPFGWFVRPDADGFVVTNMGETQGQYATEAKAIKAAWRLARGLPEPAEAVPGPEDDGEPKELLPPPIDCRVVFHEVEGMAIACSAPPRANLPNQYRILDGRGQLVRTGNFSSLVKFLEERHGGPLPAGDMRTEESFRGPEPARFDEREPAPAPPTVTRSHAHKKAFLKS